jgi:plastocyanin
MMRYGWGLLLALLCLAPLTAWADEEAAGVTQRVTVKLSEYRFEPSKIVLKVGEAVELTFLNEGSIMHEVVTLALHDLDVDIEINGVIAETMGFLEFELPPKSRATLRFTPEKPGEFPFTCQAKEPKDHFKEGMAGTLIIK